MLPVHTTAVAGGSIANRKERDWQDRWAQGGSTSGSWMIVADGISKGSWGAAAAQTATQVAASVLASAPLDETSLFRAFDLAHAALSPWYVGESRGTTLTIALVTNHRCLIGQVGDSPAYVDFGEGMVLVTPAQHGGALTGWLGRQDQAEPWIGKWLARDVRSIVVASDGIVAGDLLGQGVQSVAAVVAEALSRPAYRGDDATIVAAQLVSSSPELTR